MAQTRKPTTVRTCCITSVVQNVCRFLDAIIDPGARDTNVALEWPLQKPSRIDVFTHRFHRLIVCITC